MTIYRKLAATFAIMSLSSFVMAGVSDGLTKAPIASVAASAKATEAAAEKININKATAQDLATIKGLTITKAKAIVAYRKKNGDFKSIDELKSVKGFKRLNDSKLKEIQDHLTVN